MAFSRYFPALSTGRLIRILARRDARVYCLRNSSDYTGSGDTTRPLCRSSMRYHPNIWIICVVGLCAGPVIQAQGVFQGGLDHFEGTGLSGCASGGKVNPTTSNPLTLTNSFTCPDVNIGLSVSISIPTIPTTSTPTGDGQMLFLNGETLRTVFKFTATLAPKDASKQPYNVQYQAFSFTTHAPPFDSLPQVECDSPAGSRSALGVGDSVNLTATADCTWPKIYGAQIPAGASLPGIQFPSGGLLGLIRFRTIITITRADNTTEDIHGDIDGVFAYFSQTDTTIEAVQVVLTGSEVQSYLKGAGDKTIPLIAGKSTVVRVFPTRATSDPTPAVTGDLKLFRGDNQVGSVPPKNGPIVPAQMIDRNNEDSSLNYHLPIDLTNGDLTVKVDLEPPGGPPPGQQPKPPVQADFHFVSQSRRLNIKWLPYCYKPPGGTTTCPSTKIGDYYSLIQKTFPVADKDGISYTPVFGQSPIWTKDLSAKDSKGNLVGPSIFIAHLRQVYGILKALAPTLGDQVGDQFVAWLPAGSIPVDAGTEQSGESDPPWSHSGAAASAAFGHVAFSTDAGDSPFEKIIAASEPPKTIAHEIAHNLGLRHTKTTDQGGNADPNSCYPYGDASIQLPAFDAKNDGFIPKNYYDLMTYHGGSVTWVSPYTYDVLVRGQLNPHGDEINRACGGAPLNIPQQSGASAQSETPEAAPANDVLIISGTLDTSGTAVLNPGYRVNTAPDTSDPSGAYCLRFSGGATTLSDFCFSLAFTAVESGAQLATAPFSFQVAFPPGTTRIALRNSGRDLTSVSVSAHAPTISITSPKTGAAWNGGQQTITWTASDADGDRLLYAVLYSFDGGQNYIPLDMDLTDTQFGIDPTQLMGGSNIFFRVIATDGVNNSAATVGPIQVSQTAQLQAAGTFDFGNTSPGSTIERKIPVMSTGSGPLSITNVSFDNSAFSYSGPSLPLTVPAGGQFSLPVKFSPSNASKQNSVLKITSNTSSSVSNVQLTGQGFSSPVADIEVAPASLDFGTVASGQTKDLQIDIASLGSGSLQVSSISISNSQFSLVGAKAPITLAATTEQQFTIRFAPTSAGVQTGTITIASNDPTHTTRSISLTGTGGSGSGGGPVPQVTSGGVVNGASFQTPLARGSLATLFGTNLASGIAQASILPLPKSLGGVSLTIGAISAPVFYVSPTQINFQVPYEAPATGSVAILVTRDGIQSNSVSAPISDTAPGIFTYARTASALDPVIVHQDNKLVTPDNPAVANEALIIYATGIGALNNQPATGAGAPLSPLATAKVTPTVTVGNAGVQVLFAGLTPGFVGLAQINIQLPAKLPAGTSLPLLLQFGNAPSQQVNLSVAGAGAGGSPSISVTQASLDFGTVNVGQTKDVTLTIRNTGTAALTVNSVTSSNARFTTVALTTPLSIAAGASQTATIRFSPTAAGAQTGVLSIASNDTAHPIIAVSLTGTGASAAPSDVVLKVDGGVFDTEIGYPSGTSTAYFVNRLTPPSYPATIKSVQLYFTTRSDGLNLNTPITVVSATNPSGASVVSPLTAGSIDLVPTILAAKDTFITYSVPARTITSGDFVVGFMVANPANIYPADLDDLSPSQRRSFTSNDGLTFVLLDSISADLAGNLAIRAVVTLGSGTTSTIMTSREGPAPR